MDTSNTGIAIFKQICEVNDLDEQKIREIAQKKQSNKNEQADEAEHLIRTAFNHKAWILAQELDLGSTSGHESVKEGEEYSISADPAAPSFTIHEDFIHQKYSEDEAERLIHALRGVMLPIQA